MKVSEIVEKLELTVFAGEQGLENEVSGGYVSDLLSNVMGNAFEGEMWITVQVHTNVLAIASLKDLSGVILVGDNQPSGEIIDKANEEGIPLLGSYLSAYEITGKLYNLLQA